jgi:hypothetical protein
MSENLCEEDIVGLVLGFEAVATDGAVGAAASAEAKCLRSRSRLSAWMMNLGFSTRTELGVGLEAEPGA